MSADYREKTPSQPYAFGPFNDRLVGPLLLLEYQWEMAPCIPCDAWVPYGYRPDSPHLARCGFCGTVDFYDAGAA